MRNTDRDDLRQPEEVVDGSFRTIASCFDAVTAP
jgi:hypothetical protein